MSKKNEIGLQLKPSEIKIALRELVKSKLSTFIWGPPGIGKSQILKQIADEFGYNFVDIRLSQYEPTDLRGIPMPHTDENGKSSCVWLTPSFLVKDGSPTIYLFDEMNTATQSIVAAAYQFVLDRKLGEFEMGPDDVVFAAGNRETDRGATFKMATPLMNRFIHLEMKHDFDDWQNWALINKIDKDIIGYLNFQKHDLFNFDPTTAQRGFPTPRSWTFVSNILKNNPDVSNHILQSMIAGAVGQGVAIQFVNHRQLSSKAPNPSDILSGKIKTCDIDNPSVSYALQTGLCYELNEQILEIYKLKDSNKKEYDIQFSEWTEKADNFLGFMLKNFAPEMSILGARTALATFKLPFQTNKMKNWVDFSNTYQKLILQA